MTEATRPITPRATAPLRAPATEVVQQTSFVVPRDAVRWGPVVAGLVTALSIFVLLSLLALGVGIAAADAANAGDEASTLGSAGSIVAAIIGLLAFVIGGYVVGRSAAVSGRPAGALNGFLVWALGITVILMLGAFGLGQLFGAAGDIFGQLRAAGIDGSGVQVDPNQAADAIRSSALVAFVSLALPALAASLGGALGARHDDDVRVVETA